MQDSTGLEKPSAPDPITPWRELFQFYFGVPYSPVENDRQFRSFTGVAPQVAEKIYQKYSHPVHLNNRSKLFVVLHFLKDMPTEDVGRAAFKLKSRNTYRKWLWSTLGYLDWVMDEIRLEDRFKGPVATSGPFQNITLIVDGTDCPIDRPCLSKDERTKYHSGRSKDNQYSRYNLKYTIGVQVATGRICTVIGPDPGSMHDITSVRKSELGTILSWEPFEMILGDKGYQGLGNCLSPFKGKFLLPSEEAFNEVVASVRQLVECVLHRIKIFGALGSRGRFHCDRDKHRMVFNVCCQITNISMKREPVWVQQNWYLDKTTV